MTTLRAEFDITHDKGGFTYVSWSQVADRLDDVGEPWSFAVIALGPDWCHGRLTIGDRHYENIGYAENADAQWKKEPYKDAVSDAFKRCAALAGVARYLYDKESTDATPSTGRGATPPSRPAAPQRPVAVPDDPTLDAPRDYEFPPIGPAKPGDTCDEHNVAWGGEVGDLWHGPKPYHRHPGNTKRARSA